MKHGNYPDYENILIEREDGITYLKFNRPEKRNAMSPGLHHDMHDALSRLQFDDATEVLVVTGAGDSFCAGQDLKEYFHETMDDPSQHRADQMMSHDWRHRLLNYFPKPTIGAINGWCFGGAFTVVCSCDIVVAADEATFGLSEINFGGIPGGLVGRMVSEYLTPRQAMYYVLTGEKFDGRKAAEVGLATLSVPLAELTSKVQEIAGTLKAKDADAVRACKLAMKGVSLRDMPYEDAWRWLNTVSGQLKAWQSDESPMQGRRDGIGKFVAKEYRPGLEPMPKGDRDA